MKSGHPDISVVALVLCFKVCYEKFERIETSQFPFFVF